MKKTISGIERKDVYTYNEGKNKECTCGEPCEKCGHRKRNVPDQKTFYKYTPCPVHH